MTGLVLLALGICSADLLYLATWRLCDGSPRG
jgi:hypothetical protein